jgi:hypothetical protein
MGHRHESPRIVAIGSRLSPHRHQPLFRLAELLRPDLDRLCLAGGLNVPDPDGLGAEDQDGPLDRLFGLRRHQRRLVRRFRSFNAPGGDGAPNGDRRTYIAPKRFFEGWKSLLSAGAG